MSATVGKIINIKEWKSHKQTAEKISWQIHKKLFTGLKVLMAVGGLGLFLLDILYLRIYGLGWLGIVAFLPLFLSNFTYHTQSIELSPEKNLLTLKRQNRFHTKVLKIHLSGVIAIEENHVAPPPKVNASLGYLSLYLKNGEVYHLSLSGDATQNEHFKQAILKQIAQDSPPSVSEKQVS